MVIIIEEFLYIMEPNAFQTMSTENQIINQVVSETVFEENFNCVVFAQIFSVIYIHADDIGQPQLSRFITNASTVFNESSVALTFESRSVFQEGELTLRQ